MATQVIPAPADSKIISVNYSDASETAQVDVFDNETLAWLIDDTGAAPAKPVVLGALPPVITPTPPLTAPNWGHVEGQKILLPDIARTDLGAALTYLATANGANRKVACHFTTDWLNTAWLRWAQYNPTLVAAPAGQVEQAGEDGATRARSKATDPMSTGATAKARV